MKKAKLTLEQRKAIARKQTWGWRLMAVAGGGWFLAVLFHPLGIALAGGHRIVLLASDALAGISLAAALVAATIFRSSRNTSRTWAILLILLTIFLADFFLLTWDWRLRG